MKYMDSLIDRLLVQHGIGRAVYIFERDACVIYTHYANEGAYFRFLEKAEEHLGYYLPLLFSYAEVPFSERPKGAEFFHAISIGNAALILERFDDIAASLSAASG